MQISIPYIIVVALVGLAGNVLTIIMLFKRSLTKNFNNCTLIALGKRSRSVGQSDVNRLFSSFDRSVVQRHLGLSLFEWSDEREFRWLLSPTLVSLPSGRTPLGRLHCAFHHPTFHCREISPECVYREEYSPSPLYHRHPVHSLRRLLLLDVDLEEWIWSLRRRTASGLVRLRCVALLRRSIHHHRHPESGDHSPTSNDLSVQPAGESIDSNTQHSSEDIHRFVRDDVTVEILRTVSPGHSQSKRLRSAKVTKQKSFHFSLDEEKISNLCTSALSRTRSINIPIMAKQLIISFRSRAARPVAKLRFGLLLLPTLNLIVSHACWFSSRHVFSFSTLRRIFARSVWKSTASRCLKPTVIYPRLAMKRRVSMTIDPCWPRRDRTSMWNSFNCSTWWWLSLSTSPISLIRSISFSIHSVEWSFVENYFDSSRSAIDEHVQDRRLDSRSSCPPWQTSMLSCSLSVYRIDTLVQKKNLPDDQFSSNERREGVHV